MILSAWVEKDDTNPEDPQYSLTVKSSKLNKSTTIKLNAIFDPEQKEIFLYWAEETREAIEG